MTLTKVVLSERDMPTHWYNISADLPAAGVELPPVLHPITVQPVGPADLAPLFPMALIMQEVSTERYIEIPDQVQDLYNLWRPTPLYRAVRWEEALDTPAKIYFKYEGTSPAGSHKPNTAIPQAYYNKQEGVTRLATETGAGQWGSALAFACQAFGIECKVYMVRVSYDQKPYRRRMMQTWGATVVASPSMETNAGRQILAQDPDSTGSLGMAISEAVEEAVTRDDTNYSLGSVLNHVLLHQTVMGQEVIKQMELIGADWPDIVIGCVGGGSNFGGFAFPFLRENIVNGKQARLIAVEPLAAPSITRGVYAYDYGDTAKMAPVVKMHTLGHDFVPAPIHSGGLRYHGMGAQVSALKEAGLIEAGRAAARHLRGGHELHPRRGHPARAGAVPRDSDSDARSAGLQGERREQDHRLQPVRPRPLRPGLLRRVPARPAGGLRVSGRGHREVVGDLPKVG